jgi:hypothetical protein
MKKIELTKQEIKILLRLVCEETQKMANGKKDVSSEMYELRYKLSEK